MAEGAIGGGRLCRDIHGVVETRLNLLVLEHGLMKVLPRSAQPRLRHHNRILRRLTHHKSLLAVLQHLYLLLCYTHPLRITIMRFLFRDLLCFKVSRGGG